MTQGTDPNEAFKSWRDQSLDAWAKAMADYVNTDAFAHSLGQYLESSVAAQAQFKQYSDQFFKTSLGSLNMPSRDDLTALAERLTSVELRMDDVQYSLDRSLQELKKSVDEQRANQAEAILADLQAQLTRLNARLDTVPAGSPAAATPGDALSAVRTSADKSATGAIPPRPSATSTPAASPRRKPAAPAKDTKA